VLYEALGRLAPSPLEALNPAVAVAMSSGQAAGLELVDQTVAPGGLAHTHLEPPDRGEILDRLGRRNEALTEYQRAVGLCGNASERGVLEEKIHDLLDA